MKLTLKEKLAREKVCLPSDNLAKIEDAQARIKELSPVVGMFKVGKESYTRFGPEILDIVQENRARVFLDLKYHDIPNTAKSAAAAATEKAVWMFNVHASGGREMLKSAVNSVNKISSLNYICDPKVIGVTVLTSIGPAEYLDINRALVSDISAEELKPFYGMKTDEIERQKDFADLLTRNGYHNLVTEDERGVRSNVIEQQVLNLALISYESGLDGIVCSAADLHAVKGHLPDDFMYVTPGIEGPNTPAGEDQKRVFTAGNAVQDGSSILVVGRAITKPKTAEER